jgi:plastocyanin domain-containing protein
MTSKQFLASGITALSILLGTMSDRALAQMPSDMHQMPPSNPSGEFHYIQQPLWVKGLVTVGGLGLIGLEIWWFLFSKPKSRQAATQSGIQSVTVTVDGGYEPSQITVQAGQPVQLNFYRKDPNSCLEEVRVPEFQIAQSLPVNQTTTIQFTPTQPGQYEFTCGMNMFRGMIEVLPADNQPAASTAISNTSTSHEEHNSHRHRSPLTFT